MSKIDPSPKTIQRVQNRKNGWMDKSRLNARLINFYWMKYGVFKIYHA